jgi:hypothetical protein
MPHAGQYANPPRSPGWQIAPVSRHWPGTDPRPETIPGRYPWMSGSRRPVTSLGCWATSTSAFRIATHLGQPPGMHSRCGSWTPRTRRTRRVTRAEPGRHLPPTAWSLAQRLGSGSASAVQDPTGGAGCKNAQLIAAEQLLAPVAWWPASTWEVFSAVVSSCWLTRTLR